ncbi:carbohydrate ABC transporter permease [Gellertiella hungarica]|uniref:Multiple sugar transport system permease protein n=1 Tax=Gellertiella hungarica TaxID=1572859 RepID=A0A7W6J321_9HYPH|nr:sugar ABC transporter permease [Gellertiella hungarica]MBB4063855.1 multiple sugar transport system permease protein [Gellertiella hungarica]
MALGYAADALTTPEFDADGFRRLGRFLLRPLWLAPVACALIVTTLYPFVFLVALSLSKSSLGKPFRAFAGLKNYALALGDGEFIASLLRTVAYALLSSAIQVAAGLALALLLFTLLKGGRFLLSLFLLPLMTPPVMVGVAWKLILAPAGGLLNGTLLRLGLVDEPVSFLGSAALAWASIALADLWQWTPFVAILCFAALSSLPEGVDDAARLDGAGPFERFWYITLPLIAAPLAAIFLIKLIFAFKLFDLTYILTYGGPGFATTTTGFSIFRLSMQQFEVARAAAETLIFAALIGLVTLPVVRLHRALERREA